MKGIKLLVAFLGLGGLSGIGFFWHLGSTGLIDETVPLFAEAARQMLVTGDWITPYFNGNPRFDKPPLIYWLMAIAYRLIGVNEWAVRLPSAMAATGLVGFGFYLLWRYVQANQIPRPQTPFNPESSWLHPLPWMGAALIALNPQIIAWGRIGVSDMLLTGCIAASLFSFFLGYAEARTWYWGCYLFIGLGILAKGPIGIVIPGLIIFAFTIGVGNFRRVLREMKPIFGVIVIAAMTLPWYLLITLENGQAYLDSFFGYHNFQRFTQVVNDHSAPWYFYFIIVLVGLIPNSAYLLISIFQSQYWQSLGTWRKGKINRRNHAPQPRWQQLKLFTLVWILCIFIFFTICATKLPSYILPLMPACGILVALFWSDLALKRIPTKKSSQITSIFTIFLLLAITFLGFYSVNWLGYDPDMPNFATALKSSGLLLRISYIWLTITATVSLLFLWGRTVWILPVNLLGFVLCLILGLTPIYHLLDQHRQEPLRQIAQAVVEQSMPGEPLIAVGFDKPSLVFYTQQPVDYYEYATDALAAFHKDSELNSDEFGAQFSDSILLIAYPSEFIKLGLKPEQYQVLDQASVYQLARVNSPIKSESPPTPE
ncbi:MAG: ArnT family glycosyltransferase [Microcoleaceae cyanobacterium]